MEQREGRLTRDLADVDERILEAIVTPATADELPRDVIEKSVEHITKAIKVPDTAITKVLKSPHYIVDRDAVVDRQLNYFFMLVTGENLTGLSADERNIRIADMRVELSAAIVPNQMETGTTIERIREYLSCFYGMYFPITDTHGVVYIDRAKVEDPLTVTHEDIHAMSAVDYKGSGLHEIGKTGRDVNEAITQMLTLHVHKPALVSTGKNMQSINDPHIEPKSPYGPQLHRLGYIRSLMESGKEPHPMTVQDFANLYMDDALKPMQKQTQLKGEVSNRVSFSDRSTALRELAVLR